MVLLDESDPLNRDKFFPEIGIVLLLRHYLPVVLHYLDDLAHSQLFTNHGQRA